MSFARKVKRRKLLKSRKIFMKEFKKRMKHFKKQVKCSRCGHHPSEGENIDNWHVEKSTENIDLICTSCIEKEKVTNPVDPVEEGGQSV